MQEKNYTWYKIAADEAEISFHENNIAVVQVNGKKICIGRHQHQLFSFAYACPHASGVLADGWIDASGNVVCPVHCYRFNMKNGRDTAGEGYYLKRWPVEKRFDGVYVGL